MRPVEVIDLTPAITRERTATHALCHLLPGDVSRLGLWLVMR